MTDEGATTRDIAAIRLLLDGPGTAWLVERVRRRLETAPTALAPGAPALGGTLRLTRPTPGQRDAAARIVGRPRRLSAGLSVDLAVVEEVLRRGPWPAGLADAVVTLTGPVVDRRGEREAEAAAWASAQAGLAHVTVPRPGLAEWWDAWCGAGNLKRAARAEAARRARGSDDGSRASASSVAAELVRGAAAVLDELPTAGEPLAVLARRTLGDAHALDADRPLGRLAVAVVAAVFVPAGETGEPAAAPGGQPSATPSSPRDVWAAAGVVQSNVASTVLCLGVRGAPVVTGDGLVADRGARLAPSAATSAALEAMRHARLPVVLTLDQVRSGGVAALPSSGTVHVCENPTVVEVIAARWTDAPAPVQTDHAGSPVLVCGWGQPSTAVVELLRILTSQGATVRYHGDFDWPGLRIAQALAAKVAWEPWRFTAADYRAAVQAGGPSRPLTGSAAESPWDPGLADAMSELGAVLEEEAVADLLADDLTGA